MLLSKTFLWLMFGSGTFPLGALDCQDDSFDCGTSWELDFYICVI